MASQCGRTWRHAPRRPLQGTAPGPGGYQPFCFHTLLSTAYQTWLLWLSQMTLCSKTARGMPSHGASGNRKPTRGSRADYSKVTIHLLEVKCTYDLRVHDMVEPALQIWPTCYALPASGVLCVCTLSSLAAQALCARTMTGSWRLWGVRTQSLLKALSIDSIRRTSRILEIRRPYLTSPAELKGNGGATGSTDGGSGGGPATDAGDGLNASGPSAGQSGSRARPAPKRHREPDDGAPARPATLVLSNTGRRVWQHKHSCMTERMKSRKTVTLLKRRRGRWRMCLHGEQ